MLGNTHSTTKQTIASAWHYNNINKWHSMNNSCCNDIFDWDITLDFTSKRLSKYGRRLVTLSLKRSHVICSYASLGIAHISLLKFFEQQVIYWKLSVFLLSRCKHNNFLVGTGSSSQYILQKQWEMSTIQLLGRHKQTKTINVSHESW